VSPEILNLMKNIKATDWRNQKTEGINFTEPFYWLDDNFFEYDKKVLEEKGALSSFIHINLRENPHQLLEVKEFLKSKV
jgi:hypothetical protein